MCCVVVVAVVVVVVLLCSDDCLDQDPCEPTKLIAWAKFAVDKDAKATRVIVAVQLVTDGQSCYYCFRGWHIIFRTQYTLTLFRVEVAACHPSLCR